MMKRRRLMAEPKNDERPEPKNDERPKPKNNEGQVRRTMVQGSNQVGTGVKAGWFRGRTRMAQGSNQVGTGMAQGSNQVDSEVEAAS